MLSCKHFLYPVLVVLTLSFIYQKKLLPSKVRERFCMVAFCGNHLLLCIRDPECRQFLHCCKDCDDPTSERRKAAIAHQYTTDGFLMQDDDDIAAANAADPLACHLDCNAMVTNFGQRVLECLLGNKCMEPTGHSDACPVLNQSQVLPFSSIPPDILQGKWYRQFTNSFDTWPCQIFEFLPPQQPHPPPEPWMEAWPKQPNVWRTNVYWNVTSTPDGTVKEFSVAEEVFPGEVWHYSGATKADASHKTRLKMGVVETHENWYLLHYEKDDGYIIYFVCAFSLGIERYDAVVIVLSKRAKLSEKVLVQIEEKTREILGDNVGRLKRLEGCVELAE